jgi:hypothetical protein
MPQTGKDPAFISRSRGCHPFLKKLVARHPKCVNNAVESAEYFSRLEQKASASAALTQSARVLSVLAAFCIRNVFRPEPSAKAPLHSSTAATACQCRACHCQSWLHRKLFFIRNIFVQDRQRKRRYTGSPAQLPLPASAWLAIVRACMVTETLQLCRMPAP